jgi:hypothetical protein
MRAKLSSYALVGIDAVPVHVIVGGDEAKVVATRTRRVLHSVRLPALVAGTLPKGTSMNLAPAALIATLGGSIALTRGFRNETLRDRNH